MNSNPWVDGAAQSIASLVRPAFIKSRCQASGKMLQTFCTSQENIMPRKPTRLAICMHEAGHAIIRLANPPSPWIESISVDETSEHTLGIVVTTSMWQHYMQGNADAELERQWRALAWKDIIFYLAGPIAELRWRRYSRPALWLGAREMADKCLVPNDIEERSDFGRVKRRLQSAVPGDDRDNFVKAWLEAEVEVAKWWWEINSLARDLANCGHIQDDDLLAMWKRMKASRDEA